MPLSTFVLALWVFLQSAAVYNWFEVDPKLVAFVGMFFVLLVVVEAVWGTSPHWPKFLRRPNA